MPDNPDPSAHERLAAESLVYQFVVAVLMPYIPAASYGQIVERLNSEFPEYLDGAVRPLAQGERDHLVALGREPLHDVAMQFVAFGELRPWRL